MALFSRDPFDVPVRRMDMKGLIRFHSAYKHVITLLMLSSKNLSLVIWWFAVPPSFQYLVIAVIQLMGITFDYLRIFTFLKEVKNKPAIT